MKWLATAIVLALVVIAAGAFLTRAQSLAPEATAGLTGDAARGEEVFWASGCTSCHAAPDGDDPLVLSGGHRLVSDFGTFISPNISPDPTHGIGGWTLSEFATALTQGTSPEGQHYYPAFPYASYMRMEMQDVADLKAFMDTLPASDTPNQSHEIGFPFNLRPAIGVWKALEANLAWVTPAPDPELERGRYLVEALAHCGECHTPRNMIGGLDRGRWMAGAPNPSGRGTIPALTAPAFDWEAADVAYYLETGFTPSFDSAGGSMASVVRNMRQLPAEDRDAIAAYVAALPAAE
jgi:mono/diheme cytochrome c family protein